VTKPTVRNVKQMEVEKKLKYKSLCRDKQTWNIKCMIILATTGATGITTKRFKKKSESHSRKTFNTFATKDITHNMESTVGWNVNREWWGYPLLQEKYQEEKACDKRWHYYYYYYYYKYEYLLSQVFSSWYFSWTSGDPHHSGFKLHTAVLSILCVMF